MQLPITATTGDVATTAATAGLGLAGLPRPRNPVNDSGALVVYLDSRYESANELLALAPIRRVETGADLLSEGAQLPRQRL